MSNDFRGMRNPRDARLPRVVRRRATWQRDYGAVGLALVVFVAPIPIALALVGASDPDGVAAAWTLAAVITGIVWAVGTPLAVWTARQWRAAARAVAAVLDNGPRRIERGGIAGRYLGRVDAAWADYRRAGYSVAAEDAMWLIVRTANEHRALATAADRSPDLVTVEARDRLAAADAMIAEETERLGEFAAAEEERIAAEQRAADAKVLGG